MALIVFSLLPLQLLNSFRHLVSSCPAPPKDTENHVMKPTQIADQIEEMVALFIHLYCLGELV